MAASARGPAQLQPARRDAGGGQTRAGPGNVLHVYQVCWGRISSCQGNIMAAGKNITWKKGKGEAISSSL